MHNNSLLDTPKKKKRIFSPFETTIFFFLFLVSLNFLGEFPLLILITFVLLLLRQKLEITIRAEIIWFLLFSVSLILFRPQFYGSLTEILKSFTYPICYYIGYGMIPEKATQQKKEHIFKTIAYVLAFGAWTHYMLNYFTNIGTHATRNTMDIWSGKTLSATGQAALSCIMIAISLASLFSYAKPKTKILPGIILFSIFAYNFMLAGRTIFAIAALVAVVLIFSYIKKNSLSQKTRSLILSLLLLVAVAMLVYNYNIFNCKSTIESSNFYHRFFANSENALSFGEDSRLSLKTKFLKYLFIYPFGGAHIRSAVGSYAHDLYLDTYDEAGIFAFISIIVIVITFAQKTFAVLKDRNTSFNTKQLLLALFVALYLEFFIEPILAGLSWLLADFCILYGAVSKMSYQLNSKIHWRFHH